MLTGSMDTSAAKQVRRSFCCILFPNATPCMTMFTAYGSVNCTTMKRLKTAYALWQKIICNIRLSSRSTYNVYCVPWRTSKHDVIKMLQYQCQNSCFQMQSFSRVSAQSRILESHILITSSMHKQKSGKWRDRMLWTATMRNASRTAKWDRQHYWFSLPRSSHLICHGCCRQNRKQYTKISSINTTLKFCFHR